MFDTAISDLERALRPLGQVDVERWTPALGTLLVLRAGLPAPPPGIVTRAGEMLAVARGEDVTSRALEDPDRAYETACLFSRAASSPQWADPGDLARAGVALAAAAVGRGRLPGSARADLDLGPLRATGWIGNVETTLLPSLLADQQGSPVTPQVVADLRRAWAQYMAEAPSAGSASPSTGP